MKMLIIICSVIAMGLAVPVKQLVQDNKFKAAALDQAAIAARRALPALEHEEIHDEFGQFALRYVTAEGTVVSERGRLVPVTDEDGTEKYVLVIEGEVSYIGDDGELYITKYTAGLDGTHVTGNHLPVAPEAVTAEVPAVSEVVKSQ